MEDPGRLLPRRDERNIFPVAKLIGCGLAHGEGDRQRPRKPVRQAHVAEHARVVRPAHESLERTVRADAEQLDVGHHPGVQRDPLEGRGANSRLDESFPAQDTVDEPPTMGSDLGGLGVRHGHGVNLVLSIEKVKNVPKALIPMA